MMFRFWQRIQRHIIRRLQANTEALAKLSINLSIL
jgi:hypothetical protein